jgi:hypothetical protein
MMTNTSVEDPFAAAPEFVPGTFIISLKIIDEFLILN